MVAIHHNDRSKRQRGLTGVALKSKVSIQMVLFLDLPVDILPLIISNLVKPHHLSSACLVNKTFQEFTVPRLYERVSIYAWQREGKTKVVQLFTTLAHGPHLAKYVRRLGLSLSHDALTMSLLLKPPPEIREFPKAISLDELGTNVLQGLRNCINLRACTWTRDGSLNSDILKALQTSGILQELEVNGRSEDNYNPALLQGFTRLARISLIMPSVPVVNHLSTWIANTGSTLQSLTLICKVVTNPPPSEGSIDLLNVTHRGVWAVLTGNDAGLLGLGLEGVSAHFDMGELSRRCLKTGALARLTSITLTVHPLLPLELWMNDVSTLLSAAPLQNFHIYSTGPFYESPWTEPFWSQLVATHGHRLLRFSVHRMLISLRAIEEICRRCTALEQLFIVVEPESLPNLGACLAQANSLRSIHINYPMEAHTDVVPVISVNEALSIIRHCSTTLTQFGCNARVWQVSRVINVDAEGRFHAQPMLSPYESPDVPEAFLVVRT
ncbi:hypothetical protein D9615_003422 [Tricholomella constricta]|uniref:F-box domain-containing protein n=1 Tax=Tricholomella constricta TaxID=117010 RepID=A0A8H5HIQ2_9AGAR|nr:hypothetical protein D9615_003422 [Tricholomella constricta]